jgi:taurine dioxygenase
MQFIQGGRQMASPVSHKIIDAFTLAPMAANIGAQILDIDLSRDHDDAVYHHIRNALNRWGVLFFRDQRLSVEQYLAFGRRFGDVESKATLGHVSNFPQVGRLIKEADHISSTGDMWHTDHTYMTIPLKFTMLHAIEVPPYGGDTLFAHPGRAFATLPRGLQENLRSLRALHSRSYLIKDGKYAAQYAKEHGVVGAMTGADAQAIHPAVTVHPETGEEILFLNPGYVVKFDGWTAKHSAALLASIYDHCLQPEYQCRFRWRKGSIAIWDNRQVWHCAINDYHGHRREMHRMMIA